MLSLTLIIISIIALVIAIINDGTNNSSRSVVFGCVSCACAIPAFTSASIFLKLADEDEDTTEESTAEDSNE